MSHSFQSRLSMWMVALSASALVWSASAQTASTAVSPVTLTAVSDVKALDDGLQIQAGPGQIQITALRDDIVRVRVSPGATLPEDASWAVLPEPRTKHIHVQTTQDAASVGFKTAALDVRVERNPLRLVVRDLAGNVICADAMGRPTEFNRGGFTVSKEMPGDEHFYGLGDKIGTFDRRDQAYTLWNTDIGPQEATDPI